MDFETAIGQIKQDAIKAAEEHKVDTASNDYKAGYVRGVRMMCMMIELSHLVAIQLAMENDHSPLVSKMFHGYANGLKKIIDMSDDIIPPEYETGFV